MAIDFPNTPATNDVYTVGTSSWVYRGSNIWDPVVTSAGGGAGLGDIMLLAGM